MNISDMMIHCFNAESTLLRVQKIKNLDASHSLEVYEAILKTYIHDITSLIQKSATDALVSFADGDLLNVMLKGVKRFSNYPPQNVKNLRRLIAKKLIEENQYCF